MTDIRVFVAIELEPAFLQALKRIQEDLQQAEGGRAGRWVRPEGIHLTLKFLGDVPVERLQRIYQAVARACAPVHPFEVAVGELGCFPNLRRPRVIWVGVTEETGRLTMLQQAVERELNPLGFPAEGRGFTPHLTLARVRKDARRDDTEVLARAVAEARSQATQGETPVAMTVSSVSVIKSELRPSGAVYTDLFRAALVGAQSI